MLPLADAFKLICLRLTLLSEILRSLRPRTLSPSKTGIFDTEQLLACILSREANTPIFTYKIAKVDLKVKQVQKEPCHDEKLQKIQTFQVLAKTPQEKIEL
jgi:hypothetical protein